MTTNSSMLGYPETTDIVVRRRPSDFHVNLDKEEYVTQETTLAVSFINKTIKIHIDEFA